jgi:hypothetical protein
VAALVGVVLARAYDGSRTAASGVGAAPLSALATEPNASSTAAMSVAASEDIVSTTPSRRLSLAQLDVWVYFPVVFDDPVVAVASRLDLHDRVQGRRHHVRELAADTHSHRPRLATSRWQAAP